MAPRKEKIEKVSANEAADTILNYLRIEQATDISANLHNKVTKAAAAKILKDLHERSEIEGRPAGKQSITHLFSALKHLLGKQISPEDSCTPEQLSALDTTINQLRMSTTSAQTTAKTLRSSLSSLNSSLSTTDLISSLSTLEAEKAEIFARLETLKAGKAKKVTKNEREETENEWKKWCMVAKRREKIGKEMWKLIEDCLPDTEKKADLRESLGLDD
ncbi:Tat binding protein 1-interacting [Melanomma pulvis-pyrius CBS 109.77]|uniref:Tat binding protein 1-interacting n=1 Tax=Melanomma pulvis-pyrius CBS 109.77 TaxID=1314802 RepID=A0A6A6XEX0_9PLEO|nr:Tat binding protein 1-interacting [Melanomma pulvis-pyrius CBS 109.77]